MEAQPQPELRGMALALDRVIEAIETLLAREAELEAIGVNLQQQAADHYQRSLDEMHLRYNVESELARVRAESLRVVPVGEVCQPHELYPTQFILRDNRVWVNAPGTRDIVDITNNNRVSVPYDETVQPVRLERWEIAP